jgi:DNA-binding beta-propeller fold protein YncE
MKLLIGLAALAALACGQAPADEPVPGGAGVRGTLLVGNKGEDTLSFIDLASGRELGRAATGRMPHEIAVSPNGDGRAAVVAYGGRTIDIFDVRTRAKLRTIDLAPNDGPHGIAWLRDGRIVVTAERSNSLVVVDPDHGDAVRAIGTGQPGSHMVAVTPDLSRAFTANIAAGTVSVIDLVAGVKLRDIAVGGRPEGIVLSTNGSLLWVADLDGARVQAFDALSLEQEAEFGTGRVPIRVAASPDGRWIVTSNLGDGTLSVIDLVSGRVARTIRVSGERAAGQVTILFSRDGRRLYVAETGRNRVAEVDFASGRVLRRLATGVEGDGLAIAY